MRRSTTLFIVGLAATMLLLPSLPIKGQASEKVYERFVPTPAFKEAQLLLLQGAEDSDVERAAEKFGQIAAQNPGTTLGAVSLLQQALYSDAARSGAIYQAVIAGYPRSHFEVLARINLLDLQYPGRATPQVEAWIEAAGQLGQSYGAPALREIMRGSITGGSDQVRAMPLEIRMGLMALYSQIQGATAHQLKRYGEAVPLDLFIRDTFGSLAGDQPSRDLVFDIVKAKYGIWNPSTYGARIPIDPTVRILSPKSNQQKGPRPKIRWETTVGDYTHPQVSVANLKATLDGQDIAPQLKVRSKVRKSLKTKSNSVFERLRFTYRPALRLQRGDHTVALEMPTQGYSGSGPGITRVSWTFRVGRDRDDDYDECSDEDEDNDGWEREND